MLFPPFSLEKPDWAPPRERRKEGGSHKAFCAQYCHEAIINDGVVVVYGEKLLQKGGQLRRGKKHACGCSGSTFVTQT